jgi:monoamine oxidase
MGQSPGDAVSAKHRHAPETLPSALARRAFLRRLMAMTGAAAAANALPALAAVPDPRSPLLVVIVGAGLAGLVSAYELEKRGHRVTILEADTRHVGGRVRTLRFADGLYGEAGAMRVPARHALTRHYIGEFGLPLRNFVSSNPQAYYFLRGERQRKSDVAKLNRLYALREDERDKTPDDFFEQSIGRVLKSLSAAEGKDLSEVTPATARIRALDQQSLQQLAESAGLSAEAIEFMATASGNEALMLSAATETLREELLEVWSQGFDEIVGGTDRLAAAFASRLRSKPRMGCEVVTLTQSADGRVAGAVYRERGVEKRVEGDFLLCTLPSPVLSRIVVEPEMSGPKWRAIRQLNYDSSTKVLAVARRRFWETDDGIYGGGTFTDLPIATAYYPSDNAQAKNPAVSRGPGVMLASYSWGQAARRLASLDHPARAAVVLRHLARVHRHLREPGIVRETRSWSWDNHPLSGGAFAWFMPGQHTSLYADLIRPEGRLHFAGEHASLTHTWMQGALESGLRATREMLEAAQRTY